MAKTVAYLRVSTADKGQEFDRQVYEFDKQGIVVDKYFEEKLSGKLDIEDRPALKEAFEYCDKGDTFYVESITRLSRDTLIGLALLREFSIKGVIVKSLSNDIGDISTPEGWFMTTIMAATSQLQRDMISKNVVQALAKKKKDGMKLGRPLKVTNIDLALEDIEHGLSVKEASNKYDIKLMTLYHHIRKNKKEGELND